MNMDEEKELKRAKAQIKLVEQYEAKVMGLLQEHHEGLVEEETYEDRREEIRQLFLNEVQEALAATDKDSEDLKFKKVVYDSLLSQAKRYFGYYKAIQDVETKIREYNSALGSPIIQTDAESELKTINKIESIKRVIDITEALGLPDIYVQEIVKLSIAKAFGPVNKTQSIRLSNEH